MKNERGAYCDIQDRSIYYGDGVIGPSYLDQARADQTFKQRFDEKISLMQILIRQRVILAPLAASILLSACGDINPFSTRATASPTPSGSGEVSPRPSASPSFLPSISPSASPSASAKAERSKEDTYSLLDIPSEKWAAETFGVKDTWSGLESSWDIQNTPNGDKYAHLKQNGEVHSLVDLTKDPRAVGQASIKENNGPDNIPYEAVVLRNQKARVKEITIRISNNPDALAKDSDVKLVAKEATEQPGVQVLYCVTTAETIPAPTPSPTPNFNKSSTNQIALR